MTEQTLRIMEIERFAIHDGPGIRTVVFLQGCPLRCPWCSNPESQQVKKQLMYRQNNCIGCGRCAGTCPQGAIEMKNGRPEFDRARCIGCERCMKICPQHAIHFAGTEKTVAEILAEVLRDRDYYEESGGGVTLSGGEPFVQFAGCLELLRQSKAAGLHTAVETTGNLPLAQLKEAMPYIDTFLFDLKHTNAEVLRQVANGDGGLIFASLTHIAAQNPASIVLRVPVIPGFNHDDKTIDEIFALALHHHIPEVHLLPYHTLGKGKYAQLGLPYTFGQTEMLPRQALTAYAARGEALGLRVKIGG